MKLLITIALTTITVCLFAQTDSLAKKIPVTVFKDGKAVGIKLVSSNADSSIAVDSPKVSNITIAKDYPIYNSKMNFFEKCKYFLSILKYEKPYIFWGLIILLGFWLLRFILKLFDR